MARNIQELEPILQSLLKYCQRNQDQVLLQASIKSANPFEGDSKAVILCINLDPAKADALYITLQALIESAILASAEESK